MNISAQHEVGSVCLNGLTFGYPSQPIFKNFSWETGEPITILEGPSGCGKTTLLRILAGHLVVSTPSASRIPKPARLVLQDDGLFPWLTSEGNLALASGWRGFDTLDGRVQAIANIVASYRQQIVGTLSFGQRRLIELLRVLACPTGLTLLDEPLNFLDASRRTLVIDAIGELATQGYKFIISSHYEADFRRLRSRRFSFTGDMPYSSMADAGAAT
jgi:ABC-type multidrug transport system ATPase subunit